MRISGRATVVSTRLRKFTRTHGMMDRVLAFQASGPRAGFEPKCSSLLRGTRWKVKK